MSEYQYYDFRAVDQPLDKRAMAALRSITSRAEITPTSLVNEYHFGDFKGDPDRLMDRYFDAFVYVANWGTHRLMLRLPKRIFDLAVAKPYCIADILQARATKEHVILDFCSQEEEGGSWEEGEDWLDSLIPLRSDLLNGDLRCLYLAWLSGIEYGAVDDETEPPVPAGLNRLTASLERFAEFLRLDSDLIEVAAVASSGTAPIGPSSDELASWVAERPEAEKNKLLLRLIEGDASHLGNELLLKFRQSRGRVGRRAARSLSTGPARRTVASLRAARDARAAGKGGGME
jgi:hypothetical protein